MAGRGYLTEARQIDTSRIYTLRNGRWQKMFRPINPDRSFSGVSLAESFAEAYSKKYNVDVGLICCADGGTKLEQWMPGELLFDNAVNNARLAARTSEIVGILWHQGESDCADELYPTYQARFETMMQAFRKELDRPDIPFILGGLGDFLEHYSSKNMKNYIHVNDALQRIAENNELTGFVSATGLTANPDNLHFNAESLYTFGLRYFYEFEKFANIRKTLGKNTAAEDIDRTELELL